MGAPRRRVAPIRVVVVDDSEVFVSALRRFLDDQPWLEMVAHTFSAVEAIATVARLQPDLVLTDVDMPGMCGLDMVRHLKVVASPPRVIVITFSPEYRRHALKSGADGFVLKDEIVGVLLPLVRDLFTARLKARLPLIPGSARAGHRCPDPRIPVPGGRRRVSGKSHQWPSARS